MIRLSNNCGTGAGGFKPGNVCGAKHGNGIDGLTQDQKQILTKVSEVTKLDEATIVTALTSSSSPANNQNAGIRAAVEMAILKSGSAKPDAIVDVIKYQDAKANADVIAAITDGNVDRALKEFAFTPTYDLLCLSGIKVLNTALPGQAVCNMLSRSISMGTTSVTGDFRHELGHAVRSALSGEQGPTGKNELTKIVADHYQSVKEKLNAKPISSVKSVDHETYETTYGVVGRRGLDSWEEDFAEHYRLYQRETYRDMQEGGNGKWLAQYRQRHPEMAKLFDAHYTAALMVAGAKPQIPPKIPTSGNVGATVAKGGQFPKDPDFVSSNKANVEENQKASAAMKSKAISGDLEWLKAQSDGPSPKLNAYKKALIEHLTFKQKQQTHKQ